MWGGSVVATATERMRPKSALAPVMVFNLLNLPPLMFTLQMSHGLGWSVVPFLIMPAVAIYQLLFFTHNDPDRLQNEHHVEKKIALNNRIGFRSEGESMEVVIPLDGLVINNPMIEQQAEVEK